jgi:hypothetical protein
MFEESWLLISIFFISRGALASVPSLDMFQFQSIKAPLPQHNEKTGAASVGRLAR